MPFLKKLKIYGFKSFAYKTEIEFRSGIMGIVGPNGCGKSNTLEALMWVFGEKSSRISKSDTMIDVIFSGTEKHKPLGYAEVEVIIDNENLLLPVEYREISIKRRVYRSGESEFFINNQKCRLKDIHDLLADTGIGKGSYSFMEQGKIDMILSNRPEDRRLIFEEAAGISKYKIKLKESLQNLEKTENNLSQVNLLLKEMKQEYDKLKAQAEKAKIYNEYNTKLKELEVQSYAFRYKTSLKIKLETEKKLAEVEDKLNELNTKLAQNNVKIENLSKQQSDYIKNKYETEKEQSKIQQIIKSNEEKIKIYQSHIERNENLLANRKNEINKIIEENNNLKNIYSEKEEELKKLREEIIQYKNEKEFILKEIEKIENKIKDNLALKNELKNRITQLQNELVDKKKLLEKLTSEFVIQIDRKKKEVEGTKDLQLNLKNEIISIIDKISVAIEKNELNEVKNLLSDLKSKIEAIVVYQDEFKNLIFDKNGVYAQKENVDNEINLITEEIITNQSRINEIETENHKLLNDEKILNKKLKDTENLLNKLQFRIEQIEGELEKIKNEIEKNNNNIEKINSELENLHKHNQDYANTISKLREEISNFSDKTINYNKSITQIDEEINSINQQILHLKNKNKELNEKINDLTKKINEFRETISRTEANLMDYEDTLYDDYNVKIKDVIDKISDNIDLKRIREEIEKLKVEIRNLGHVNLSAEEEFKDLENRYNFTQQQRDDLLKAKNDLLNIISETNKECTRIFLETFDKINENFHYIFRRLFNGGKAEVLLEDPSNPLESGIMINVQPPGKKLKSISWLSGGERDLSAISLMFSIFLVKPAPFCALDEIDSQLDEKNTQTFIRLMREFSQNIQFILISHNPSTLANVDYLYGVSMEEPGITNVYSLELKNTKTEESKKQEIENFIKQNEKE